MTLNVGIIGVGYWGRNYLRIFSELEDSRVVWCVDTRKNLLRKIIKEKVSIKICTNYLDMLSDKSVDCVCIVTPASTHFKIAKDAILADKHLLIEKPFTLSSREAEYLVRLAEKRERVLVIGHTFLFNPYIKKLKEIISEGQLGKIYHIHSMRVANGPVRADVNCVWDLAVHDFSILQYLLDVDPNWICTTGESYLQTGIVDVAFIKLKYPNNNMFISIHLSWFYPTKIRKIIIVGSKRTAVFDDIEESRKLKIFSKEGKVIIPHITPSEPLKNECTHFLNCIKNKTNPLSDGELSLKVIKLLEFAQRSLDNNCLPVSVKL